MGESLVSYGRKSGSGSRQRCTFLNDPSIAFLAKTAKIESLRRLYVLERLYPCIDGMS